VRNEPTDASSSIENNDSADTSTSQIMISRSIYEQLTAVDMASSGSSDAGTSYVNSRLVDEVIHLVQKQELDD
jgi:hypothetical protein